MQGQKQALPARLSHLDKAPTKPVTDDESRHDASSDFDHFVLASPNVCRICHNTRWCQDITPRNGKDLTGGSLDVMSGKMDGGTGMKCERLCPWCGSTPPWPARRKLVGRCLGMVFAVAWPSWPYRTKRTMHIRSSKCIHTATTLACPCKTCGCMDSLSCVKGLRTGGQGGD